MGRSQELREFQRDTMIGCLMCNKSSREISSLLNVPESTVSDIITKWKRLGTTANQPQSDRPIAKDLQTSCGLQISSRTVRRELHGMGCSGRAAASKPHITKCNAKCRMPRCKARRHWTLEQWRCVLWSESPDLKPTEHLWVELEWRLWTRPSRPTSVSDLTNALLEEWSKIPINTLLNLQKRLPRRFLAAKGGPTSY